jgi:hypothetical protein
MTLKKISAGIICIAMILTGCQNPVGGSNENNGNNETGKNENTSKKLSMDYLSNFVVDINDATALGIIKRPVARIRSNHARAVTDITEIVEKNYLVKTTTDISSGDAAWDENGLTDVTFKKKTTVDETVFIPKVDEEGNPVYLIDEAGDPIVDGEGNPVQEMEIVEAQIIMQDKIPAQVNRIYVYNSYTYIQFVPVETTGIPDIRPDDLGVLDKDGYYAYDKQDYYNDDFHQSFVIENSTGNIYSLAEAVWIASIHNGLLTIKDSPYIYDHRINDNNELEIFSLFQNTAVTVYDYYKDKYGNNYIFNEYLDTTDTGKNTVYHKNPEYHISKSGEVVYIRGIQRHMYFYNQGDFTYYIGNNDCYQIAVNFNHITNEISTPVSEIKIMGENCSRRSIEMDDYFEFEGYDGGLFRNGSISHIKNNELFIYNNFNSDLILVLNTDTAEVKHAVLCMGISRSIGPDLVEQDFIVPVSYNIILIQDKAKKKLYYYRINFESLPVSNKRYIYDFSYDNWVIYDDINNPYYHTILFYEEGSIKLLFEGFDGWTVTTLQGQEEYTVNIKEVDGERIPVVVKTSEYMAEEQQIITLKPINR